MYKAVLEAIWKQNHWAPSRDIFQRFGEHKIYPAQLLQKSVFPITCEEKIRLSGELEQLLLKKRYANFMAAALALLDAQQHGLMADSSTFSSRSLSVAREVAGKPETTLDVMIDTTDIP